MKEIIGLTVFCTFAGLTMILAVRRRIGTTLTVTLLMFSLLSGFLIVNYDFCRIWMVISRPESTHSNR